MVILNQCNV